MRQAVSEMAFVLRQLLSSMTGAAMPKSVRNVRMMRAGSAPVFGHQVGDPAREAARLAGAGPGQLRIVRRRLRSGRRFRVQASTAPSMLRT